MKIDISVNKRQHIIDALRGFTIISIMLLHNIEHFDCYFKPQNLPDWVLFLDHKIWDAGFFLFGGKSYGIFALLFGVTFFIQTNNQEQKGVDFRPRFVWRLVLLMVFGVINSIFFQGDILLIYAFIGLLLIPFYKINNKIILIVAFVLLLQPLQIYYFFEYLIHPETGFSPPKYREYFGNMKNYIDIESFIELAKGNLINGRIGVLYWNLENRIFHIMSFFLCGLVLGRKHFFYFNKKNTKFWKKTLMISTVLFVVFYLLYLNADNFFVEKGLLTPYKKIIGSWRNVAFMLVLISLFYLVYYNKNLSKILTAFIPIGKMSLSNYVFQSIIGSFIYYNYGLGMYKYTGATYCLFIGIVLSELTYYFCKFWLKYHKRGPLETVWHKITWMRYSVKNNQ